MHLVDIRDQYEGSFSSFIQSVKYWDDNSDIRLSVQTINAQRLTSALATIIDICKTDHIQSYGKTETTGEKQIKENIFTVPA